MSMATPATAGRRARRSGAGDASPQQAIGRISQNQVSVVWAARFSRRKDSARTFDCHRITAPQLPFLSICSLVHNASPVLLARIHSSRLVSMPQVSQAIACGKYGGCTSAIL